MHYHVNPIQINVKQLQTLVVLIEKMQSLVFVTDVHTIHHHEFISQTVYNTRVRVVLNI